MARTLALAIGLFYSVTASASLQCTLLDFANLLGVDLIQDRNSAAVMRVTFPGTGSCTGTLVNNVLGDGRPLILTARHCIGTSEADLHTIEEEIRVIYTRRDCLLGLLCLNGRTVSTQGASVRMSWGDLVLLEAWDAPPAAAEARFAGLSLLTPEPSGFGLHYSSASMLQFVSQRFDGGSRSYVLPSGERGHPPLHVDAWTTTLLSGATPTGSSGSALFGTQGYVHGVLSGGVICGGTGDNNYYQKLSAAWIGGGTPETSLRYWIDPAEAGAVVIDGASAKSMANGPNPPGIIVNEFSEPSSGGGGSSGGAWSIWGLLALMMAGLGRRLTRSEAASR